MSIYSSRTLKMLSKLKVDESNDLKQSMEEENVMCFQTVAERMIEDVVVTSKALECEQSLHKNVENNANEVLVEIIDMYDSSGGCDNYFDPVPVLENEDLHNINSDKVINCEIVGAQAIQNITSHVSMVETGLTFQVDSYANQNGSDNILFTDLNNFKGPTQVQNVKPCIIEDPNLHANCSTIVEAHDNYPVIEEICTDLDFTCVTAGAVNVNPGTSTQKTVYQEDANDFDLHTTYEKECPNSSADSDMECETSPKKRRTNAYIEEVTIQTKPDSSDEECIAIIEGNNVLRKASTVKLRLDNKQKKDNGKEYVDRKGNVRPARKQKCKGCRFQCKALNDTDREYIFQEFWKIGDHNVQSQYITSLIQEKPVVQSTKKRKKSKTNLFFLKINNNQHRVCKTTFLGTLGIGKRYVDIISQNASHAGTSTSDKRGKKEPGNKSKKADVERIHTQISKFPSFECHYSRRDSKKKYLHPNLTVKKMYDLYKEECISDHVITLSYSTYYNIFKTKNLSFKKPYNDTLKLKSKDLNEDDRKNLESQKQNHLELVDKAYKTKANDKILAKESNGKIVVKAFDLQKVLETPFLTTGISFYKRQLSTYNLTTHDLATNKASSYLSYESIGGRGSDEIASVLYKDIQSLSDEVEHLIYYSDNCTGQNHNFTLPLMYNIVIKSKPTLKTIEHKFLVVGHTHMECDSDHSRIERAKPKDMDIFIPRDWSTMIRMLKNRRGEPFFKVIDMTLNDIYDFKSLYGSKVSTSNYIKRQRFTNNDPVEWSKTRWIKIDKANTGIFSLSQKIDTPEFKTLSIIRNPNKNMEEMDLKIKNKTKISISTKKYKDLMELLELIPEEYHPFYRTLPHSNRVLDTHADIVDLNG